MVAGSPGDVLMTKQFLNPSRVVRLHINFPAKPEKQTVLSVTPDIKSHSMLDIRQHASGASLVACSCAS